MSLETQTSDKTRNPSSLKSYSRADFIRLGYKFFIKQDEPVIVKWCNVEDVEGSLDKILGEIGQKPAALFKKRSDPETKERSHVTKVPLHEFFENRAYEKTDEEYQYRIVTNIKNQTTLINRLLNHDCERLFPYKEEENSANLWINYKGQFGRAHFDEQENFNFQLAGSKRFIFLPPAIRPFYTRSILKGFGHHSDFPDLLNVDLERYPLFASQKDKLIDVTITPGELLYIPIGWWHQVHPVGELNINLNFWLKDRKIRNYPYIWLDAAYKAWFRKIIGKYDYQPLERKKGA